MNPIFRAAYNLQKFCEKRDWLFCFIGGLAVQRWGQPRFTQDVDVTLFTGFGNENVFIKSLLRHFQARIKDAANFALKNRVLLLIDNDQIPIDIALGAMPFEENCITRSYKWYIEKDKYLRICSAEDLIVHKAFANRKIDWFDIEGIIQRQNTALDFELVFTELQPLVELKEEPEILVELKKLIDENIGRSVGK